MWTFTPLLRVVEKPCIDADDEVFSRRRLKQKQVRRKRAERTRTRRTPRTAPSTAQLVSPSVGLDDGLLEPSSGPLRETSTKLLTRPLMPPSPRAVRPRYRLPDNPARLKVYVRPPSYATSTVSTPITPLPLATSSGTRRGPGDGA